MIDFQHLVAQLLLQAAKLDGGGGALLSALALDLLHFVQGIDERGIRRADGLDIHHAAFPKKVNIEFVNVLSSDRLRMRVWERGSGVTLACGTGSCATAVAGVLTGRTGRCITVLLDGGELQIEYSEADNHVYMTGPACEVFQGAWTERF